MTLAQAKYRLANVRKAVRTELKGAVSRTLTKAQTRARRESSGPLREPDFVALNRPYARRHGGRYGAKAPLFSAMASIDPAVINVQSGEFRAAWSVDRPQAGDSGVSGALINESRVADFLEFGTRYMVRRPIVRTLERYVCDQAYAEVTEAVRRLERYYG